MRSMQTIFSAAMLCLLLAGLAVAGIVSGKVSAISADGKSVTVENSSGKKTTFKIAGVKVLVNDKEGKMEVGMTASIFTDSSNQPTKIQARTASAAKPKVESTTPKTTAKSKPARSGGGQDWPGYLGINRNNISLETGLLKSWPSSGPKLLWTAPGVGEGFSTVAVADGKIFTMGNVGASQSIMALDLQTGKGLWQVAIGKSYSEGNGNGPRGTPTVDGEFVYGLSATGDLACLETSAGNVVWNRNVFQDYEGGVPGWGVCESVLIDGDKVLCTPGGKKGTVVALDKRTGKEIWTCIVPGDSAGYASIVPIEVGGVKQYVQFTHGATIGVRAKDGKLLWQDNGGANGTANCSSIGFFKDMVFSSSGYGHGAAMVKLTSKNDETAATQVYATKSMKSHHGGFVVLDGYVYGSDEGVFTCLDIKTGKPKWQDRAPGKGSVIFADGMLIVRNEGGPITLVQASPAKYTELGKFDQPERSGKSAWAYPVVAQGKLFLRDMDKLFCYDLKGN